MLARSASQAIRSAAAARGLHTSSAAAISQVNTHVPGDGRTRTVTVLPGYGLVNSLEGHGYFWHLSTAQMGGKRVCLFLLSVLDHLRVAIIKVDARRRGCSCLI